MITPGLKTEFGVLVETQDGSWTIKHEGHGQDFHSSEGAKFEAWELYIVASGLHERLTDPTGVVTVLDVGMGLGYNAAATIAAWWDAASPPHVELVSLEIDRRLAEVIADGTAPWLGNWEESWLVGPKSLRKISDETWRAALIHPDSGTRFLWTVLIGDAVKQDIPQASAPYDYIWQDPFTPELNPTMWNARWFQGLKTVAKADAKLMTYSVARVVKDALTEGGWEHERFRTPGRKRHWLKAQPK